MNPEEENEKLTLGQHMADRITEFAGSWTFISFFAAILFIWMILNSLKMFPENFDPYPFILLNLVLSCIAAVQAPIILMSQGRQAEKDAKISREDYEIDKEAHNRILEIEKKIDELLEKTKNN